MMTLLLLGIGIPAAVGALIGILTLKEEDEQP